MQNVGLKQRSDLHLTRKIWHCVGICGMAAVYNLLGRGPSQWILLVAVIAIIPFEYFRQRVPIINRIAVKLFSSVMRAHEVKNVSGTTWLLVGCVFLLFFKNDHIVTLTLLFLAFGDPIASFFGIRFGKDRIIGNKTLQGTMAAFVVCTVIASLYYYFNNLMTERLLIVAPLSGLIGALAELSPYGKLDDNLTFPITCGVLLWLLFQVYGGFGV